MTVQSRDGQPVEVHYENTTVTGGIAPVSTKCTPPSGTALPVGITNVTCTAIDARVLISTCGFTVTVAAPPRLSVTRFEAFGDSITEGKLSTATFHLLSSLPTSYPSVLQGMLTAHYTAQTVIVYNEGLGGEQVVGQDGETDGVTRLPRTMAADAPEVLLLLEGVNDLNSGGSSAMSTMIDGLRTMIRTARGRGARVFVGTLLPQRPGAVKAYSASLIVPANDQIRSLATGEGATLVDTWAAFNGVADPYIGPDGLHPNVDGYAKIAQTFFDAIKAALGVTQAATAPSGWAPFGSPIPTAPGTPPARRPTR